MEGRHASGGAIMVGDSGQLAVQRSNFAQNDAGGRGILEKLGSYSDIAQSNRMMRAKHIDTVGDVTLVNCTIASADTGHGIENAAQAFIVGRRVARVVLESVRLSSTVAVAIALRLFDKTGEALVRGCSGTNVTIEAVAAAKVGVVSSNFNPALPKQLATIRPPDCGQPIAGKMMCDPRASCSAEPTGGVVCACDTDGYSSKPGVPADGRQCLRGTRIETLVATTSLRLKISKPGRIEQVLIVNTRVEGEVPFLGVSTMNSTLRRGNSVAASSESARAFGVWFDGLRPNLLQPVKLDAAMNVFSWQSSSEVHISLNCSDSDDGQCAAGKAPSVRSRVSIGLLLIHSRRHAAAAVACPSLMLRGCARLVDKEETRLGVFGRCCDKLPPVAE